MTSVAKFSPTAPIRPFLLCNHFLIPHHAVGHMKEAEVRVIIPSATDVIFVTIAPSVTIFNLLLCFPPIQPRLSCHEMTSVKQMAVTVTVMVTCTHHFPYARLPIGHVFLHLLPWPQKAPCNFPTSLLLSPPFVSSTFKLEYLVIDEKKLPISAVCSTPHRLLSQTQNSSDSGPPGYRIFSPA